VATFVRSIAELTAVADYRPFSDAELTTEGHTLYIGFVVKGPDDQAKEKLMSYRGEFDDFQVQGREVYWLCRTRMVDSKFSMALMEKVLGVRATFRNSTTVKKIAAKYS